MRSPVSRLTLLILIASILAALAMIPTDAGAAARRVTRGSRYLALGDSFAFGYQEPQEVPPPNYYNPRSFRGYPEQLAAQLHLKVASAACPGETSVSFIHPHGPSNGCENSPSNPASHYRGTYPLHVRYKGSQLTYALSYLRKHRGVTLVSLMIGGNDLLRCVETTGDGCLSSSEQQAAFATIRHNVRRIVSVIRHEGRYHGQLVIVNYPSPFASAFFKASVRKLNRTIDNGAKPFHVAVADSEGAFQIAEAHSGGDPCQAGLLVQEGSPGKCGLHPSYAGQALMAQAVLKVIRM